MAVPITVMVVLWAEGEVAVGERERPIFIRFDFRITVSLLARDDTKPALAATIDGPIMECSQGSFFFA